MDVFIPREDGSTLRCYEVGTRGPGVLLLHPWWGLTEDVMNLADRIAAEGYRVMAPDLFDGRTADTPEGAEQLVSQADARWDRLVSDAECALAHLRDAGVERAAAVGLSFGAAYGVILAAQGAVDALVLYYGTGALEEGARVAIPVLGHFADEDPYEPDGGEALFEALRESGATTEHYRYPGTSHWFVEPSHSHYRRDAAELAWERTLTFLHRTLAG